MIVDQGMFVIITACISAIFLLSGVVLTFSLGVKIKNDDILPNILIGLSFAIVALSLGLEYALIQQGHSAFWWLLILFAGSVGILSGRQLVFLVSKRGVIEFKKIGWF
jgi:hypothetical protein